MAPSAPGSTELQLALQTHGWPSWLALLVGPIDPRLDLQTLWLAVLTTQRTILTHLLSLPSNYPDSLAGLSEPQVNFLDPSLTFQTLCLPPDSTGPQDPVVDSRIRTRK